VDSSCKQAGLVSYIACFFCACTLFSSENLIPFPQTYYCLLHLYHVVILRCHIRLCSRLWRDADWLRACHRSPKAMHRCVFISSPGQSPSALTRRLILLQSSIASRMSQWPVSHPPLLFANCVYFFARRDNNASCSAIEQNAGVNRTALECMNPGLNCMFLEGVLYSTQFQERAS
jgi:hypothetical protein